MSEPSGNPDPGKTKGQPSIASAALFGLCPKCGAGGLFKGLAQFAPKCTGCGLNFASFNVGDGPAAFLTMIIGTLVTVLAGWMALRFDPPVWVYVVVLVPVTLGSIIWGLRAGKAALLASEFKQHAGEGRRIDQ